jgi:hypothetical protein
VILYFIYKHETSTKYQRNIKGGRSGKHERISLQENRKGPVKERLN